MLRDQKTRLWILGVLVVVTALIAPIFFSQPRVIEGQSGGDTWRNIIYDFQTLFTGILAIGAAAFTIIQSRIIDERQQRRHEELFNLQVRPDKLRVARAWGLYPTIVGHKSLLERRWRPLTIQGRDLSTEEMAIILSVQNVCDTALASLNQSELQNARDLFDGKLHQSLNDLQDTLRVVVFHCHRIKVIIGSPAPLTQPVTTYSTYTVAQRDDDAQALSRLVGILVSEFDEFLLGFSGMAKEYKVI